MLKVLSLFDGMSCGKIALDRVGINVSRYYASEIKPHAISLVKSRYPSTIQLGDIRNINIPEKIDLLIGGSPCKGLSSLNQNQEGLSHPESALFWEFSRLYKEAKNMNHNLYFLLENTRGKKKDIQTISNELGVRPIRLNSSLVSAQNRPRLYWTNIPISSIPKDKKITTKHVFDEEMPEDLFLDEGRIKWLNNESGKKSVKKGYTRINPYPKSGCLTSSGFVKWNCNYLLRDGEYRHLSIRELERLQTLPPGYCDGMKYADAYDVIGDGWTIDIVAHLFSPLKNIISY